MLVVILNSKGGVGKSKVAIHLAVELHDRGLAVELVDTDPQGTAARQVARIEPAIPVHTPYELSEIEDVVTRARKTADVVIADTPGTIGEQFHSLIWLADKGIIVLQPSPEDADELRNSIKYIRVAQKRRRGKPETTIVLNCTAKGDVEARKFKKEVGVFGLPVAKAEIRRLNTIRDVAKKDTVVTRLDTLKGRDAAKDFRRLIDELLADSLKLVSKRSTKRSKRQHSSDVKRGSTVSNRPKRRRVGNA